VTQTNHGLRDAVDDSTPARSAAQLVVLQDRRLIRARRHSHRFLVAEVTAPQVRRDVERPAVNLAFVLDRSGSMHGRKLQLAARAVEEAIDLLRPTDRFAIVVYDTGVDVLVHNTPATQDARRAAVEQLRTVRTGSATNLSAGWLAGCEQVAGTLLEGGVDRCLLLTDGLANHGITDATELARHARELRARGVSTSTFGVGQDFDEALLQSMASSGGGQFYYIEDAAQIPDHIGSEVGEVLEVVAREVRLELTLPEHIRVESLASFPALAAGGGRVSIDLGDLVSGQQVEVPLRLAFSLGETGAVVPVLVSLSDRDGSMDVPAARLAWEYADDAANDVQPRDRSVDRIVATVFAARTRQEAVALNRVGRYDAAAAALRATSRRIRGYAGQDRHLQEVAMGLAVEADQFANPLPEPDRKAIYSAGARMLRSRDAMGRAKRS
jgi:Ca-activated chloride channel homolog